MDLKANTVVDVLIGPFVDSTDGNTTEDGLTLSQADIKLSKNGQDLAQKSDDTPAEFDDDGYYNCELNATDTNTEGQLVLIVHESGALPVRHEYNVMAEAAWDSLYAVKDTGYMDVNVKAVSEDTTAADNLESACDNYSATRGLTGTALPAAAADAGGGLPISDAGGLDLDAMNANIDDIEAGGTILKTTIATLASQTSFTLTAGSADDDAYNGCTIIIEDVSTAVQKALGVIKDYTGASKTITLVSDPGIFTMAATDKATIIPDRQGRDITVNATAVRGSGT